MDDSQPKPADLASVPSGWVRERINEHDGKRFIYVHRKTRIAQWKNPRKHPPANKVERIPVPPDDLGKMYIPLRPQPELPKDWIQFALIPIKKGKKVGSIMFGNSQTGELQSTDPTPNKDSQNSLPAGWAQDKDPEGFVYFINKSEVYATYDDPRVCIAPVPSKVLNVHLSDASFRRLSLSKDKKHAPYLIGPRSRDGFNCIGYNLADKSSLPPSVQNKTHNRYLDIIPNPDTCVTLQVPDGDNSDGGGTYINANYIRGHDNINKKVYIAAMGPLPTTVQRFHQMIWENKAPAIICLTGLIEKGRQKCALYWPLKEDTSETYGEFILTSKKVEHKSGFIENLLEVKYKGETRNIMHWWYNTWPDHDVPRDADGAIYTDDLLDMNFRINNYVKKLGKDVGPMVVHCSAGVGRTGTYIAIDHGLKQLKTENKCDPLDIMKALRQDRCAMIQHCSQFFFVHDGITRWAQMTGHNFKIADPMELEEYEMLDEPIFVEDQAKLREEERKAAQLRAKSVKRKASHVQVPESQKSGELNLRPLVFEGKSYYYEDKKGLGAMDWATAQEQDFPRELFDNIAGGKETISVSNFQNFQSKQYRVARRASSVMRPQIKEHAASKKAWYAGEVTQAVANGIVRNAAEGSFLVRRDAEKENNYLLVVCDKMTLADGSSKPMPLVYRIMQENGAYLLGKALKFSSLDKLISNLQKKKLLQGVGNRKIKLGKAAVPTAIFFD
eukprot:m.142637 g.142637  ORF g.142637 m.142637 type:complete len:727 (+) comp14883_c0_seq3:173-2353(+)